MMRAIYRFLSAMGDIKAAWRGPRPYVTRKVRQHANRHFNKMLRKWIR